MRNVISTVSGVEVPDEYSEAVETILGDLTAAGGQVLRETYQGQDSDRYRTRLVTYPAPITGETLYAVDDADPATHEVEETADHAEANARYEEVVRDRVQGAAYSGNEEILDYSDVEGVAAKENPTADTNAEEEPAPRCTCGYFALDADDLDEHFAIARHDGNQEHAAAH